MSASTVGLTVSSWGCCDGAGRGQWNTTGGVLAHEANISNGRNRNSLSINDRILGLRGLSVGVISRHNNVGFRNGLGLCGYVLRVLHAALVNRVAAEREGEHENDGAVQVCTRRNEGE